MRVRHAALSGLVTLAIGSGAGPGCVPSKVTRLYVATDATRVTPRLFHSLRVEVLRNGAPCGDCTREFPVDDATWPGGIGSFDIEGDGLVLVRLELVRIRGSAQKRPAATVEARATLDLDGAAHVAYLPMAKTGHPFDLRADALEGTPSPLPLSLPSPKSACADASREGEVCIPGGHFWMGDPLMDITGLGDAVDGTLERIVTVDAFHIDRTEVTVGALRKTGLATASDPVTSKQAGCTFPPTANDATADALPVNCMTVSLAEAFCKARGAELPTEAEFEYVAGALRSESFVWGDARIACGDAVVGFAACPLDAPRPVGSAPKDALTLAPGRAVFDIVGNVHEFMQDRWNPEDGPCWGIGAFHNPVCKQQDARFPNARVVRGGAFADLPVYASAALREFVDDPQNRVGTSVGFRCRRR